MRSFSKKLAFVLAAAMVFTAFAPAAKAEAAAMKINKSSKILYVTDGEGINDAAQVGGGKGNVAEYDFSVSNKPKDYKKTHTFEWSSSDEDVIEVGKAGLTKAVGVGVANVVCVVTEKATGKATTLKSEVTVKANAAEVVITNADDYADLAYEVGAEIDLNRAMYDAEGKKAPKRGVKVTDYTRWMVEPSAGVKVTQSNGKYVFTDEAEAGTYKLWCETYQSSKYTKATAKSQVIEVELVKEKTVTLAQTTKNKFTVTFDKAVEALAASDVKVDRVIVGANGETLYNNLVKGVSLNDAKTVATVELYNDFVNNVEYQVTVTGYEMETLVASVGAPASIVLTSSKYGISNEVVADGEGHEIYARLFDAKGIDVTKTAEGTENINFKITYTTGGYTYDGSTGKSLYFSTVGDYAVVEATYHDGKYDDQGNPVGKVTSAPFTFVGVDKSYVSIVGISKFCIGGDGQGTTLTMDNKEGIELGVKFKLADGNDSSYVTDDGTTLIKDKDGNSLNVGRLELVSLDTDVLEVFGTKVYPYKTGTAVVMVYANKNGQRTAIAPITIEVKAAKTLTSISFDNSRVVVSTDGLDANDITVSAKDQYGNDYTNFTVSDSDIKGESDAAKAAKDVKFVYVDPSDAKKILVDETKIDDLKAEYAPNANAFALKFSVTAKNPSGAKATNSFVIEIRNKTGAETYDIEATGLKETNVARRVTKGDHNPNNENVKSVTFSLYQMQNGAKIATQAIVPAPGSMDDVASGVFYYKLTRNGNNITSQFTANDNSVTVVFTGNTTENNYPIVEAKVGGNDRGAGVYELTVYKGTDAGKWKTVASERVTTTFDAGSYSLVGRRAVEANSDDDADILKCFGFKNKEGKEMSTSNVNDFGDSITRGYVVTKNDKASGAKTVFVESVTFYELIDEGDDSGKYVAYKVNVNQSVKIKTN